MWVNINTYYSRNQPLQCEYTFLYPGETVGSGGRSEAARRVKLWDV